MRAFDFIVVLFSFVYAAAVAQILATAGDIVIASDRIKISWLNAGWMLNSLLVTCAWWIGLWELRGLFRCAAAAFDWQFLKRVCATSRGFRFCPFVRQSGLLRRKGGSQ